MINLTKSKIRKKLFEYFIIHPNEEFYLREISRLIDEDATNLSRELKRLEEEEIFVSEIKGKQKYYKLNKNYKFFKELKNIVSKSVGIENRLKEFFKNSQANAVFIYGSYASNKMTVESDVDLFIIGDDNNGEILDKIEFLEKEIGREINYRIYSSDDFQKASKEKNSFILNILKNKKIFIKGDEKVILRLCSTISKN